MSTPSTTVICPRCGETGHSFGRNCPAMQTHADMERAFLATRVALRNLVSVHGDDYFREEARKALRWPLTTPMEKPMSETPVTQTQIDDAVERLTEEIKSQGEIASEQVSFVNDIQTILTALQQEQERLDWLLKNCDLHFNGVGRMPTRERIDQLRKELQSAENSIPSVIITKLGQQIIDLTSKREAMRAQFTHLANAAAALTGQFAGNEDNALVAWVNAELDKSQPFLTKEGEG